MTAPPGSSTARESVQPPPHAPELGFMHRLLGRFHVTGVFWFRLHAFGVRILPDWALGFFIALFTTFFFLLLVRIRRAIGANLEAALGPCGFWQRQARIYRTLWNFAWCLTERYEGFGTDRRVKGKILDEKTWYQLLEEGQGLILVTAHIGHWEAGASQVPMDHRRPVHVVREEEIDPRAQAFLNELMNRDPDQNVTMHFAQSDPMLGMKLLAALRRGEIVAIQGDRPSTGGRSHEATLFGRPMSLPVGPAALARTAGVPMLPVFVYRRGRLESEIVFREPIRVPDTRGDEVLAQATQKIAEGVEWAIRRSPHQWFCFRKLWPRDS